MNDSSALILIYFQELIFYFFLLNYPVDLKKYLLGYIRAVPPRGSKDNCDDWCQEAWVEVWRPSAPQTADINTKSRQLSSSVSQTDPIYLVINNQTVLLWHVIGCRQVESNWELVNLLLLRTILFRLINHYKKTQKPKKRSRVMCVAESEKAQEGF